MRELLRMMLADAAIVIRECEDGAGAFDAYATLQPDWVLIDADMTDVDGIAVTGQLIAAFPDARIIIVTNYDEPELRQAAFQAGARRYVLKEDLLSLLDILAT